MGIHIISYFGAFFESLVFFGLDTPHIRLSSGWVTPPFDPPVTWVGVKGGGDLGSSQPNFSTLSDAHRYS